MAIPSIIRIIGSGVWCRVGRPLRAVLGKPKKLGDPVSIDTAEAYLVEFDGEPRLTDETREVGWFDYPALKAEQKIVGRDVTPFGRTLMFALWGVSLAAHPMYTGHVDPDLLRHLGVRGVDCPEFVLSKDEHYLVRCYDGMLKVWQNLSLAPEANERGVLPGGCLEPWFGR